MVVVVRRDIHRFTDSGICTQGLYKQLYRPCLVHILPAIPQRSVLPLSSVSTMWFSVSSSCRPIVHYLVGFNTYPPVIKKSFLLYSILKYIHSLCLLIPGQLCFTGLSVCQKNYEKISDIVRNFYGWTRHDPGDVGLVCGSNANLHKISGRH